MIAIDPDGMDTHLSGQAAQDFFIQLRNNYSNKSNINGIDNLAQSTMEERGGESAENFTLHEENFKTYDVKYKGAKVGTVYMYFDKVDEAHVGVGIFGGYVPDENSPLGVDDVQWIQRVKTDNLLGKSPNEKLNEWFTDQDEEARNANVEYHHTSEWIKREVAAGHNYPVFFGFTTRYSTYMADVPLRENTGKQFYWEANLSLVSIKDNNLSLLVWSYGFSVNEKGKSKFDKPKTIKESH